MARMIDAIREDGIILASRARGQFTKDVSTLLRNISQAEPIVADEVFRYALEVATERTQWSDLPCVAPPYDRFWLEGRSPGQVRRRDGTLEIVLQSRDGWKCSGFYAQCVPLWKWLDDVAKLSQRPEALARPDRRDELERQMLGITEPDAHGVRPKWIYSVSAFIQSRAGDVYGPTASVWLGVQPGGEIGRGRRFITQDFTKGQEQIHGDGDGVTVLFDPFWLTVSMFHVKNMRLEKSPPVDAKLARARARRKKPPLVETTTIVVDPVRETLRRIDEARREGRKVDLALHHVRAHYKTFTSDKPLFGRVTGRFFWPVHIRGAREHGERKHVYDVKPDDPARIP